MAVQRLDPRWSEIRNSSLLAMRASDDTPRPHWLAHITQSVLYDQPVTFFAKNEAQTGLVLGLAQEIVYSRQIKVHLSCEFRFKFFDLEIFSGACTGTHGTQSINRTKHIWILHAKAYCAISPHEIPADTRESLPDEVLKLTSIYGTNS
jgi:hypothetical protein